MGSDNRDIGEAHVFTTSEDFTVEDLIFDQKVHDLFPGFDHYPGYEMKDVHKVTVSDRLTHEDGCDAGVDYFLSVYYGGRFGNFPKNWISAITFTVEQHLSNEENHGVEDFLREALPLFGSKKKSQLKLHFKDFLEKNESAMIEIDSSLGGTLNGSSFPTKLDQEVATAYIQVLDALGVEYQLEEPDGNSFLSIKSSHKNAKYNQDPFGSQVEAYIAARESGLQFDFSSSSSYGRKVSVSENPSHHGLTRKVFVARHYPLTFMGEAQKRTDLQNFLGFMGQHFRLDNDRKYWSIDYTSFKKQKKQPIERTQIVS
jgi:hypothetical protein